MSVSHHLYACAKDEPTRRVSMYEVDTDRLADVLRMLEVRRATDVGEDYYRDGFGGLWWVKTYVGQGT